MRLLNKNYRSCFVLKQFKNITFFILSLLLAHPVVALNESAQTFTLDGQLYQTGTTTRLLDASAKLTIQIISADGTCLLYEEQQTVNTLTTDGHFTVNVGSQTGDAKRTVNDPGRSMNQIFQNLTAVSANSVPGQTCAGGAYTPSAGAVRYFRLIVTPSATNVADTLSPDIVIDSVPAALVAQSVQGLERANILQVNNSGSTVLTQANLEALFTTPAYANLQSILAGNFMPIDSSGATLPSYAANPAGVANGDIWFDTVTNEIKYKNAAGVQIVGTSSGGISSLTVGSSMSINGSVAGTISSGSGTIDLANTGVTAGTYTKMTVDAKGRVTAGTISLVEADIPNLTVAGKVSGNTITSGTISGSAGINTSGNLISTATVSGLTVQATNLRIYNGANYIQFTSPVLAGIVNFTLPDTDGDANQVLTTNGSGVLSWAAGTTTLAGDVSGPSGTTSVDKIKGKAVTAATVSGQMMIYDGTAWANHVMSGDATMAESGILTLNKVPVSKGGTNAITFGNNRIIASNGTGSALQDFTCSLNQVITFDASGNAACANVSSLSAAILNGGNTTAANISVGTNDNKALQFKTNNSVAMTISQSGNVGIGNTMPDVPLHIGSGAIFNSPAGKPGGASTIKSAITSASANASISEMLMVSEGSRYTRVELFLKDAIEGSGGWGLWSSYSTSGSQPFVIGNGDIERFRIDNSGYIGIGTSTPSSALTVSGSFTAMGMSSAPGVAPANNGRIYYDYSTNKFKVSQNGAAYVDLVSAATSAILNGGNTTGAAISIGTNDNKTFSFKTNNTIAMTISQGGNVGIGTTSPESKLHIVGDGNAVFMAPTTGTNGVATYMLNTGNGSLFGIESDTGGWLIAGSNPYASIFGNQSARDFQIGTNNAIRMTIDSAGNTGIGISNPSVKLEVAGAILSKPTAVTNVATALDLTTSNTFTIPTASGSAFTLSGMVNGGEYTVVFTDTTSRTYTFACTGTTKYKPANGATTAGTTSIYSIMSIKNGANYDCYVTWATGYQ